MEQINNTRVNNINMKQINNTQEVEDNRDESDYEFEPSLAEIPSIDDTFRQKVLESKHTLYKNIVLAGHLETEQAQDNRVLLKYLNQINNIYKISLNCQDRNKKTIIDLSQFPEESRESLNFIFNWIRSYFSENSTPYTEPYKRYIEMSYHEYPYTQNESFPE